MKEFEDFVAVFDTYRNSRLDEQVNEPLDEITSFQRGIEDQALSEARQHIAIEYKENLKQKKMEELRSKLNIPISTLTVNQLV